MAQFFNGNVLKVVEDTQQVYEDGKAVEGKRSPRVRALVRPTKPDPVYVTLTGSGDEIVNTFRAVEGRADRIMFPSRLGVTESGTPYLSLGVGIELEDIEVLPAKSSKPLPSPAVDQAKKL